MPNMLWEYMTVVFDESGFPKEASKLTILRTNSCVCQREESLQATSLFRYEVGTGIGEFYTDARPEVYRGRLSLSSGDLLGMLQSRGVSVVVVPLGKGNRALGKRLIMGLPCDGFEVQMGADQVLRKWVHSGETEVFSELRVGQRVAAYTALVRLSPPTKEDRAKLEIPRHLPVKQVSTLQFLRLVSGGEDVRID